VRENAGTAMQATRTLPSGYAPYKTVDIAKDKHALLVLNILSVGMLLLAGWLMLKLTAILRPDVALVGSVAGFEMLLWLLLIILALGFMIILHEAIHGLFFWLYTRERPLFAFKGAYAYAAAPNWYIPRNPYMIVGIAPLVVISLLGIALLLVVPEWLILLLLFIVIANAAGAVGDIAVVGWLLFLPQTTLICDQGDAVTLYCQQR
jgi:hypothetical protein